MWVILEAWLLLSLRFFLLLSEGELFCFLFLPFFSPFFFSLCKYSSLRLESGIYFSWRESQRLSLKLCCKYCKSSWIWELKLPTHTEYSRYTYWIQEIVENFSVIISVILRQCFSVALTVLEHTQIQEPHITCLWWPLLY